LPHVGHRAALTGALHRREKVGNGDRSQDADDRNDDQQLDERETLLFTRQHVERLLALVFLPYFGTDS
jgi:hypothetical protein